MLWVLFQFSSYCGPFFSSLGSLRVPLGVPLMTQHSEYLPPHQLTMADEPVYPLITTEIKKMIFFQFSTYLAIFEFLGAMYGESTSDT